MHLRHGVVGLEALTTRHELLAGLQGLTAELEDMAERRMLPGRFAGPNYLTGRVCKALPPVLGVAPLFLGERMLPSCRADALSVLQLPVSDGQRTRRSL